MLQIGTAQSLSRFATYTTGRDNLLVLILEVNDTLFVTGVGG